MLKKFLSVFILISILVIGFTQKDALLHLIRNGGTNAVLISILLVAITVFFPIVPFYVLAALIGSIFGVVQGVFISLVGAMLGTMIFFFISRYGFRDWAQEKLKKYPKIKEYEEYLNRRSFLAILVARLIPVIPVQLVNTVCGLSKVNALVFFFASALGKIPNILILSFAGATFAQNKLFSFVLYGVYLLVIFIINFIVMNRKLLRQNVDN